MSDIRPVGPVRPRTAATPAAPAPAPSALLAFGRIDADGFVFCRTPEGEIQVGQWVAGTPDEGLAFYARRYDDLAVDVQLSLTRVRDGRASAEQAQATVQRVREALATPACIGDLAALRRSCDELDEAIVSARAEAQERRAAAKEQALAAREAIVVEAESLAGSTQWKSAGARLTELFEAWQKAPRADKARETELWKRFSAARTSFERARRQHFGALEATRKEVKAAKEALIAEAERLASTTDWAAGTRAYRDLMDRWKAAGRASKSEDDALWTRFRATQDRFFAARGVALDARSADEKENLVAKQALADEAEKLLPIRDVKSAKRELRSIQERWEKIGHVPRADRDGVEGRLKKVEDEIRRLESDQWRRSNPETRARAEDTTSKFEAALAKLVAQRDEAQAKGDIAKAQSLDASIASTQALLDAARGALDEFRSA